MEKITVIVPCYNEQEALHYYYEEMSRVMNEMKEVGFELLFINDGSKDKTSQEVILVDLVNPHPLSRHNLLYCFQIPHT